MTSKKLNPGDTRLIEVVLPIKYPSLNTVIEHYPIQVGNILRKVRTAENTAGVPHCPIKKFKWRLACGSTDGTTLRIDSKEDIYPQLVLLRDCLTVYLQAEVKIEDKAVFLKLIKSDVPIFVGSKAMKLMNILETDKNYPTDELIPNEINASLVAQAYQPEAMPF